MPEERICPLCGRANPLAMPRCINCGQRIAGGSVLLAETTHTELGAAGHEPWWQSSAMQRPGGMPLPPQVREQSQREELARAEAVRREAKRRLDEEEKLRRDTIEAEVRRRLEAEQQRKADDVTVLWKKTPVCTHCGADLQREGQGLSFCHGCGADAPVGTVLVPPPGQAQTGSFVPPRQPRSTVNSAAPSASSFSSVSGVQQAQQATAAARVSVGRTASPVGVAIFSFFVPGVGQILNKQTVKGALLLLLHFFIGSILDLGTFGIGGLIIRIVAAIDAYRIAERRRRGETVRDGEWDLG